MTFHEHEREQVSEQRTGTGDPIYDALRSPRLNERILFGITRWVWLMLAWTFLVIAMMIGFWRIEDQHGDLENEIFQRGIADCAIVNDLRATMIEILRVTDPDYPIGPPLQPITCDAFVRQSGSGS